jgi:hypothetical protein
MPTPLYHQPAVKLFQAGHTASYSKAGKSQMVGHYISHTSAARKFILSIRDRAMSAADLMQAFD